MSLHQDREHQTPRHAPSPQAGGALIDAQGREVPITEQMIQQACEALEQSRVERSHHN
nr:PA1571 family protein [uncultured Pseudomonas sp.]